MKQFSKKKNVFWIHEVFDLGISKTKYVPCPGYKMTGPTWYYNKGKSNSDFNKNVSGTSHLFYYHVSLSDSFCLYCN